MEKTKDLFTQMRDTDSPNELNNIQSPSLLVSKAITASKDLDMAMIDTLARAIVQPVIEGLKDPAEIFADVQKLASVCEIALSNLKPLVYAKQYATKGETYIVHGVELSPAELGVKYDYLSTQDGVWLELNMAFDAAKKKKEEREKFLKGIKVKLTIVNDDTGEVSTIFEPVKSGQMGYKTRIL